jgi:N6-adenosine-specific RNA methylase IME4
MTVAEICELPVGEMAAEDAHLYLWTTNRYLPAAFDVVKAWGFRYTKTLVWCKTPRGLGPGGTWSQSTEYVLFARRGSLATTQRYDTNWFNWPRQRGHSKKPEAFLDMVEATSPGPYLELFARRNRLGWDTWGNESLEMIDLG